MRTEAKTVFYSCLREEWRAARAMWNAKEEKVFSIDVVIAPSQKHPSACSRSQNPPNGVRKVCDLHIPEEDHAGQVFKHQNKLHQRSLVRFELSTPRPPPPLPPQNSAGILAEAFKISNARVERGWGEGVDLEVSSWSVHNDRVKNLNLRGNVLFRARNWKN